MRTAADSLRSLPSPCMDTHTLLKLGVMVVYCVRISREPKGTPPASFPLPNISGDRAEENRDGVRLEPGLKESSSLSCLFRCVNLCESTTASFLTPAVRDLPQIRTLIQKTFLQLWNPDTRSLKAPGRVLQDDLAALLCQSCRSDVSVHRLKVIFWPFNVNKWPESC